jgi:serine/threonine-protein kinase
VAKTCPECRFDNPEGTLFCGKCGTKFDSPEVLDAVPTKTIEIPQEELTTGTTFAGRYQIIEELGKGGMGRVYKVLDTKINEKIALKLIRPDISLDKNTITRFSNELKLARKVRHKNICQMFDLGEERGTHFITMEFVPGEDLKSMIRMSGHLAVGTTISIAKQICLGLTEAHDSGVVHRDLKPSNIMIDKGGNARIMDFGIARSLKAKGITGSGVMIGTPEYMSPEQVEGKEVDQRSDIYSLGVILYEMITGKVPFEGDTPFTIGVKHKSEIPKNPKELNAQMPDELSGLILRCLEKDRETRYQSAEEVLADLNNIERGMPVMQKVIPQKRPLTSKEITLKFDLKTMLIPLLTGVVLIVLAWFFFFRIKEPVLDPNLVLVTVFDNQTGMETMDPQGRIAADTIAEGIAQMDEMEVVPVSALPEMEQSPAREQAGFMTVAQIQELAKQAGAGIVITGSYYITGEGVQFSAKITDAQSGKLISSVSSELGLSKKTDSAFTPYLDYIINLRQRVMGVLAARLDPYMAEILSERPPTYEAYQEYRLGFEYFSRNYNRSLQHYQRANELDPTFMYPLIAITTIHSNNNRYEEAQALADKINQQRDKLTDFDRFRLDARIYSLKGDWQQVVNVLRQAERNFPNSFAILDSIGVFCNRLNHPQEAINSLLKIDGEAISKTTAATSSWYIGRLLEAYHMLGDFEKELDTIQNAEELFPDRMWPASRVRVLAALGRVEHVQRLVDDSLAGLSKAGSPSSVLLEAVEELRVHGHMGEAQNIADRLTDWTQKQMPNDPSEDQLRGLADRFYLAKRWDGAYEIYKQLAENHADSYNHINYIAKLGCIAARKGNREEALRISEELGSVDRPYIFGRHTYLRACIASLLGEKQQAVDLLHQAMREGLSYSINVIRDQDLLPLKEFPPFQEFIKPKG